MVVMGVVVFVVGDVSVTVVGVVAVSDLFGARITNFSSRERVTAKITKMIKEMQMIVIRRQSRGLCRSLFPVLLSKYTGFLCIVSFTRILT